MIELKEKVDGYWVIHTPLTDEGMASACDMAESIGGPIAMLVGALKAERAARLELVRLLTARGFCGDCGAPAAEGRCQKTCENPICSECLEKRDHVCVAKPRLTA